MRSRVAGRGRRAALAAAVALAALGVGTALSATMQNDAVIGVANLYAVARHQAPLLLGQLSEPSVLLDADGNPIATFYSQDRIEVPLNEVSPYVTAALISAEDRTFYTNPGIEGRGILRALVNDLLGRPVQGGSTLTQQFVKNVIELRTGQSPPETISRKLAEAAYAAALTRTLTKAQILDGYLNTVYFGEGAYGIEAAARRFFSEPASALSLDQAATLTALVRDPQGLDPLVNPRDARAARDQVLADMVVAGHLSRARYRAARSEPLVVRPSPAPPNGCYGSTYPYFCEWVLSSLDTLSVFGSTPAQRAANLASGGYTITTTLNPSDQTALAAAVTSRAGVRDRVGAALVSVQPGTGDVLGMAQNRIWGLDVTHNQTEVNYATSPSPVGSTMKAFTLATALTQGVSPTLTLPGGPTYHSSVLANPPGGYFTNAEPYGGYNPSLATATADSINTAFVQLEEKVGVLNIAATARSMGLPIPTSGPGAPSAREGSFTLGARAFSPLEMAAAYATLANGGVYCAPLGVASVVTRAGKRLSVTPTCHRAISTRVAREETQLLDGVVLYGTGTGAAVPGVDIAGKTGTTQNYGSAWFIGYTPNLVTASWMGDPRGPSHPLLNVDGVAQVYGGTLPAAMFAAAMNAELNAPPLPDSGWAALAAVGVRVPDVLGLSGAAAAALLTQLGLSVTGALPGVVTASWPGPGSVVTPNTPITLRGYP